MNFFERENLVQKASVRPSQWGLQMLIRAIKDINLKTWKKTKKFYYINEVIFFIFKKGITANKFKNFHYTDEMRINKIDIYVIKTRFNITTLPSAGKLSSGHRTGKGQFSFQSQRKEMPKNVQTIPQLHSSHTLQCSCWRIPGMEEPGRLPSMGSQRVRHD